MTTVALVQHAPTVLNKNATIENALGQIAELAAQGANLIVFPEAFIPGYPAWIWRLRPGGDWGIYESLHSRMLEQAVDVDAGDLMSLQDAARTHEVMIVCGFNERNGAGSGGTLYNSLVVIDAAGAIVNHHRKVMPTNPERMVWGLGDGQGVRVVDSPLGKLGALICWENYMPLARSALYAEGVQIYIAPTYDSGDAWIGTMQHIAREGRCWVLSCGVALERSDLPDDFPNKAELYPEDQPWINPGDSHIVAPDGKLVAGPLHNEKGVLLFELDPAQANSAKRALDVAGHYARPDIFSLHVNRTRPKAAVFSDE